MQKRAVQFTKKPYLALFSSETADKFARDYTIEKTFCHALRGKKFRMYFQRQGSALVASKWPFWERKDLGCCGVSMVGPQLGRETDAIAESAIMRDYTQEPLRGAHKLLLHCT